MKTLIPVLLLIVGLVGVGFKFLKKEPEPVPPTPVIVATPPPPPPPVRQEPVEPDLSSVSVAGRTITNCSVKSVTELGITFVSDQGLVQALFSQLSPEFSSYYKSRVTPVYKPKPLSPSRSVITSTTLPTKTTNSPLNDARQAVARQSRIKSLKESIRNCEATLDRYSKQSSFRKEDQARWVTSEEYDLARAIIEQNKAELRELE